MKNLFLIRGLPGSGKTTLANVLSLGMDWATKTVVLSADDFFEIGGEYVFDPQKLKDAHLYSQTRTQLAMEKAVSNIFVANTFTQEWEMKEYFDMAEYFGYTVFCMVVENRHGNKSVHNVPDENMTRMKNRFEIKL